MEKADSIGLGPGPGLGLGLGLGRGRGRGPQHKLNTYAQLRVNAISTPVYMTLYYIYLRLTTCEYIYKINPMEAQYPGSSLKSMQPTVVDHGNCVYYSMHAIV